LKIKILLFFIILLSSIKIASSNQPNTRSIAYSDHWLNLYYYKNSRSRVVIDEFFFTKDEEGRQNPEVELNAAIRSFSDSNSKLHCKFPARYTYLSRFYKFPHNIKDDCPDLMEWISNIDADGLYLIFASAYPNNPASMFGHTLFRFAGRRSDDLLNYSVGFLANATDENPLSYAYKGLTGGFLGYFSIKPFYENIGIYNNSEGRDLYEFKINFSQEEVDYLVLHLWELVHIGGIPYYFLDDNCSYFLLLLLNAIRPSLNLDKEFSKSDFIIPVETLKILNKKGILSFYKFRPSIKSRLIYKTETMTFHQKISFLKAIHSIDFSKTINDPLILDGLIDYWNYTNYKKKTNLSISEKERRDSALLNRALIKTKVNISTPKYITQEDNSILKTHNPSRLSISINRNSFKDHNKKLFSANLKYMFGNHNISDSSVGYNDFAYIDYFGLNLEYSRSSTKKSSMKISSATLIDIRSLTPSTITEFNPSWKAHISYQNSCFLCPKDKVLVASGGVGVSGTNSSRNILFYLLFNANFYSKINPYFEFESAIRVAPKNNKNFSSIIRYKQSLFNISFINKNIKLYTQLLSFEFNYYFNPNLYWGCNISKSLQKKDIYKKRLKVSSGVTLNF
jgi:hypothetical protein